MYVETYKELVVWRKSIELVKEIYITTAKFPKVEVYGLASQMRRSAVSIPSNIAEGYKRQNPGEYIQFLSIADGSTAELETQIIIGRGLYETDWSRTENLLSEVQKRLNVIIKKLKSKRRITT